MDFLFGLDKSTPPLKDLELLTTVNDQVYQSIIESVLTDNDIPFLTKEKGSGSAVKVIMGFSLFGADIFVLKSDIERARELLDELSAESDENTETDEEV